MSLEGQQSPPPPIFISEAFEDFWKAKVLLPFTSPHLYDEALAPMPWTHAVFARPGTHKLNVVSQLAEKYNIHSVHHVDVKFGETTTALQDLKCKLDAIRDVGILNGKHPQDLVIVNHAEVLCYQPDSSDSLMMATHIAEWARNGASVVALFDRVPNDVGVAQTTPFIKECHERFFDQFDTNSYIPSPHREYRIELFRWCMARFSRHMVHTGRAFVCVLTPDDYANLADYSIYSVTDGIIRWLKPIFLHIVEAPDVTVLNMERMLQYTNSLSGAPRISRDDECAAESHFSEACGKGPIVSTQVIKPKVETPLVSGMTESGAVFESAAEELERKKREREKDEEVEHKVVLKRECKEEEVPSL